LVYAEAGRLAPYFSYFVQHNFLYHFEEIVGRRCYEMENKSDLEINFEESISTRDIEEVEE